jgi:predicted dehydrogenase/threonine dehydrogenase-like Zn-dependent dehydrogenase
MKQVVQNLRSGVLELLDVPCPRVSAGHLLIQTRATVISAGTERMLVEFGRAGMVAKARQQPEKVRQVFDKIKTDGLLPTLEAVLFKLDEPLPLGYCNAGVVVEVGAGVRRFGIGDRVVSNGPHAEMVHRPENLCAKIPDKVSDDQAPFAVLGAIGLQGIRLLHLELGESVAVFGLGLIGLLAVQMLVNSGHRVLAIDPDARRLELARQFGATVVDLSAAADPVAAAEAFTAGHGIDAVLITASAKDDSIVSQSAQMSRQRGRIVLVGTTDLELNRAEFYEKELTFQVSCSYGPGRYDPAYEQQGIDYPYGFVRWTEQRNIEAVLEMLASGRLNVEPLITRRLPNDQAAQAYELLVNDRAQLGIVLQYPAVEPPRRRIVSAASSSKSATPSATAPAAAVRVGIIGAGMFASRVLIPALKKTPAQLRSIASAGGVTAAHSARKFGIAACTSDPQTIFDDPDINAVVIATRHDSHAKLAAEALRAGKHVFVEKPLAIDREGLEQVTKAYQQSNGLQLLVGFNRRFSPHGKKIRELLAGRSGPAAITMLVNAGKLPDEHWLLDPRIGGGRIIGEGCHWFDLMSFVLNQPIVAVSAATTGDRSAAGGAEATSVTLRFADGSQGTLHYFAQGHRGFPKERMTVFSDGRVLELDDFRRLWGWGWPSFSRMNLFRQDKGHRAELAEFVRRIAEGGPPLIEFTELMNVTEGTLAAAESKPHGQNSC